MTDWHPATVDAVRPAAEGLTLIRVDVRGTPLVGAHQVPGQYVKLTLDGAAEGFFAIASPPDPSGGAYEFLIRGGAPLADALVQARPGTQVKLTAPGGKGYPLSAAKNKHVLLFATGSGISPIHSLLQLVRRDRGSYGEVTLFFGARTPTGFAYSQEIAEWEAQEGIQVIRTVSQPGETGWPGLTGYVQAHIGSVKVDNTVAFICGQKGMVQGVTEALVRRGLPKENIFLNF